MAFTVDTFCGSQFWVSELFLLLLFMLVLLPVSIIN